jgi:CRISPR-associated protein Csx17
VAGFASGAPENTRGEIWLPLWNKPCNLYELKAFIAEGRSTIEGRSVKDGIDFARAVASLGIDRGIQSFVRMQFQERLGGNYLATFLGVIPVAYNRTSLLLNDFDRWRSQLRNACSAKKPNPPVSVLRAVNTLENAIFAYCRSGTKKELTGILSSVGQCVRRLASSPSFACEPKHNLRPLPRLSLQWIDEADDGSPEFRLACALASIQKSGDGEHSVGPLSSNMVPYNHHNPQAPFDKVWMEKPHIVWSNGSLISNLIAVLRRRCMDAARFGLPILPLEGACPAPLSDVISFVGGQLDEERIESFLWGLNAVDWRNWNRRNAQYSRVVDGILPPAYALLKLTHATYLPDGRLISKTNPALPFDPGIVAAAAAGRCAEATRRAARRLRASGWTPLITTIGGDSEHVRRCAAAAMFPLCSTDLRTLSRVVLRGDSEKHETISVKTDQ